jgi:hypothetical protein
VTGINGLALQRHLAPTGVAAAFPTAGDDAAVRETFLGARRFRLSAKAVQRRDFFIAVESALRGMPKS